MGAHVFDCDAPIRFFNYTNIDLNPIHHNTCYLFIHTKMLQTKPSNNNKSPKALYICKIMKKLVAIIVSFLFLLPSVGLHIDLKHCCGGVETIGISHQAAVAVSDCCDMQKTASCESNLELIVPQHIVDASLVNSVEVPSTAVLHLPFRGVISLAISHYSSERIYSAIAPETPTQALLQVFLC